MVSVGFLSSRLRNIIWVRGGGIPTRQNQRGEEPLGTSPSALIDHLSIFPSNTRGLEFPFAVPVLREQTPCPRRSARTGRVCGRRWAAFFCLREGQGRVRRGFSEEGRYLS